MFPFRFKNIKRIRIIVEVAIKYGFKDVVYRIAPIRKFIPTKLRARVLEGSTEERVRLALDELGGTFVKLGQFMSLRTDILSEKFTRELSKLQDEVEPVDFSEIKGILTEELGGALKKVFSSFDKKAIAAASLAQVYKAECKKGEMVVVKVLRPGIKELVESDLSILSDLARLVEKYIPEAKKYQPREIIKELERNLKRELNFSAESRAIQRFKDNFEDEEDYLIPQIYPELTTSKVLTLEYIEGLKITDPAVYEEWGLSKEEVLNNLIDFTFKQMFDYKLFHADPHPGNIVINKKGQISLLDFGLIGFLHEENIDILSDMLIAVTNKDVDRIVEVILELESVGEKVNLTELKSDIRFFMDEYYNVSLEDIEFKEFSNELFFIIRKYGLRVPKNLVLLIKTVATLEGVAFELDPEFNVIEGIKPYIRKVIKKKYSITKLTKDLSKLLRAYLLLFKKLPGELSMIIREVRDGTIKVNFEHKGLDSFIKHAESSINRLSVSMILAALIVGSSLLIQSDKFTPLGIGGYILAGVLGLSILISMFRSRK
jgi:ubiquinone biosynthesis protein